MAYIAIFPLAVCLMAAAPSEGQRTWTDRRGNTVDAEFVRVHGAYVVLRRGTLVRHFPYSEFSDPDAAHICCLVAAQQDDELRRAAGFSATQRAAGDARAAASAAPSAGAANGAPARPKHAAPKNAAADENPFADDAAKASFGGDFGSGVSSASEPQRNRSTPTAEKSPAAGVSAPADALPPLPKGWTTAERPRDWTGGEGTRRRGKLLSVAEGSARLLCSGKEIDVPIAEFGIDDQIYLLRRQGGMTSASQLVAALASNTARSLAANAATGDDAGNGDNDKPRGYAPAVPSRARTADDAPPPVEERVPPKSSSAADSPTENPFE